MGPRHRVISISSEGAAEIRRDFLDETEVTAGSCWLWKGERRFYGKFDIGGRLYPAHRVSVLLFHESFNQTLHVLHKCDVKGCVNPDHLWQGDDAANMQDCASKGRLATQINPGLVQGENNGQHKLTADEVLEIRHAHALGARQLDLASRFGVKAPTIHKIVTRLKWRHLLESPLASSTGGVS